MTADRGFIAAAITPRGKRGELNYGACFELIDLLCKAGAPGIALMTSAGEYPAFTMEERSRLVYLGAKRSRAPVLAGVGAEDLATSVELAREASAAGAVGVILPPPLLFSYPVEDLHEYYLQFAGQAGRNTEVWIEGAPGPDELMRTGKFAGVCGSGLRLSVEACAIPELLVDLECARRTGNAERQAQLEPLAREFSKRAAEFPPLVAVKAAVEQRKIAVGAMPLPLAPGRAAQLEEFRSWFARWLPVTKKAARA